jgi:metallo-beta-lactamase class B
MTRVASIAIVPALLGCGSPSPDTHDPSTHAHSTVSACEVGEQQPLGDAIELRCIAPHVWQFTAIGETPFGPYPANGLVLFNTQEGTLLIDTAWTRDQGQLLLDWAREQGAPVHAAIVTHFHDDRLGGIGAMLDADVPVYASWATMKLAHAQAQLGVLLTPDRTLDHVTFMAIEWLAPGPGHSPDNIVVYHPESGTLFAGCFVKDAESTSLGNLADADVAAWPAALARTREAFPDARQVVPGHGALGSLALLDHTAELLRQTEPHGSAGGDD